MVVTDCVLSALRYLLLVSLVIWCVVSGFRPNICLRPWSWNASCMSGDMAFIFEANALSSSIYSSENLLHFASNQGLSLRPWCFVFHLSRLGSSVE